MDQERWTAALAHRERLLRIARARLGPSDDVEDVVQEAILRCVEYDGLDLARIGPFLTSVTVRLCADVHRRSEEPDRARRWLVPLLEDAADPADLICRDVESQVVAALVADLPERQRNVLVDRASGMSIPQISARHKLTYKSVESALSRARAAMRAAVGATLALGAVLYRSRRTVAITAVPATALTLVGLVLVSPHGGDREAGDGPAPPAASVPFAVRPVERVGQQPPPAAGPAGARAGIAAARVRPVSRGATEPPEPIFRGPNDSVVVKPDDDDDTPVERAVDCVTYGPDVTVDPERTHVGFKCRRAPDN